MIVYIENPQSTINSNCLVNPTEDHIETEFDPKFEECKDIEAVKLRLQHMENNGLHIRNGRGMVFRSYSMIETIKELEASPIMFRMLTRTCGLRPVVYRMITGQDYNSQTKE